MARARYSIRLQHIRRGDPDNVLSEHSLISTTPWDRESGTSNIAIGLLSQLLGMEEGEAVEVWQNDLETDDGWQYADGIE